MEKEKKKRFPITSLINKAPFHKERRKEREQLFHVPKERKLNEVSRVLLDPANLRLILSLNNVYISSPLPKTFVYVMNVSLAEFSDLAKPSCRSWALFLSLLSLLVIK